jgi:hypothetical protein
MGRQKGGRVEKGSERPDAVKWGERVARRKWKKGNKRMIGEK